jgi:hypothetical protein
MVPSFVTIQRAVDVAILDSVAPTNRSETCSDYDLARVGEVLTVAAMLRGVEASIAPLIFPSFIGNVDPSRYGELCDVVLGSRAMGQV